MGPKKIKRSLYAGEGIPSAATPAQVESVMFELFELLQEKLREEYRWLASCYVAVMAGNYGGQRRVKARRKLLGLINECRTRLQLSAIVPPSGWEQVGLYYGFGAVHAYASDKDESIEQVIYGQFFGTPQGGAVSKP